MRRGAELVLLGGLVVAQLACGPNCDLAKECALDGYAAYDSKGKLDPSTMCGAKVSNDGQVGGGQCGTHFHWDTPAGRCSCDAIESCEGIVQDYSWSNCHAEGTTSGSTNTSGTSGPGTTGTTGTSSTTGTTSTSGPSSTSGTTGPVADAGCTPNSFVCGTDPQGNQTLCPGSEVCCYTLGPGGSQTCGAVSVCQAPSAVLQGVDDQCSAGQYQLCKFDSDCGNGYHCSGAPAYYCLLN
jgi:hypothetical protein